MDVRPVHAAALGLTAAEAEARRRHGETNTGAGGGTRTYAGILRTNVFSFFNTILFVIGVALLVLGRYSDAFISVGLGLVNAVISAAAGDPGQAQARPAAAARPGGGGRRPRRAGGRGAAGRGRPRRRAAGAAGRPDRGRRARCSTVGSEADESLLTGESDPVVKEPGDELRSGSLCVAGAGHQLARDVGAASYAGRLTAEARRVTTDPTPLQRRITFVVRLVIALTVLMSSAILAQAALEGFSLLRVVQITAVLSGLVPYGLFFLIAVAYTAGAGRIAGLRRARAAGQRRRVGQQRRRRVHRQDRHADHRPAHAQGGRAGPAGRAGPRGGARRRSPAVSPHRTSPRRRWWPRCRPSRGRSATRCRSCRRCAGPGWSRDHGTWVLGAPEALAPHLTAPLPGGRRERAHGARAARARPGPSRRSVRRAA